MAPFSPDCQRLPSPVHCRFTPNFAAAALAATWPPLCVLAVVLSASLLGASLFGQPAAWAQEKGNISALGAPTQSRQQRPTVQIEFEAEDSVARVIGRQLSHLMAENLEDVARVRGGPARGETRSISIEKKGQRLSIVVESSDVPADTAADTISGLEEGLAEGLADQDLRASSQTLAPDYTLSGQIVVQNEEVMELGLSLYAGQDLPALDTFVLRADVADWRQVAHALSNTLHVSITGEAGHYDSQIAFVAADVVDGQVLRRLALIDQAGGGLRLVPEAGNAVQAPAFLTSRFELVFVDQTGGKNNLRHYNLITGRLSPLARVPDLIGAPAVALGGRVIAFSSAEEDAGDNPYGPADIYIVDVAKSVVLPIEIPGSFDIDPTFSDDLRQLAFISVRDTWAELVLVPLPLGWPGESGGDLSGNLQSLLGTSDRLRHPDFSPDGSKIAFVQTQSAADGSEDLLMIYDLGTQELREVARGPSFADPTWSPDSRQIALVVRPDVGQQGVLVRVDVISQEVLVVPTPFDVIGPAWSPATGFD